MLITEAAVPAAGTYTFDVLHSIRRKEYVNMQANLTFGSGGTSIKVFLQTSLDNGVTWRDSAALAFLVASLNKAAAINKFIAAAVQAAATDGALADDTINNGMLGNRWRVKIIVAGTYAASTLRIDVDMQDALS